MAPANHTDIEVDSETIADINRERAWIEAAGHDPLAFEQLYNRYLPRLYAYAFHRLRDKHIAEDLVADTFLKASRALVNGRFQWRDQTSFAAWLFRIAHNLVSDQSLSNQKWDDLATLEEIPHVEAGTPLPEEVFLKQELRAHLRLLVSTLSPRRQEVIILKFFGELRNQEIAAVLGLDERTVASHLCLAIRDLHDRYTKQLLANGETP